MPRSSSLLPALLLPCLASALRVAQHDAPTRLGRRAVAAGAVWAPAAAVFAEDCSRYSTDAARAYCEKASAPAAPSGPVSLFNGDNSLLPGVTPSKLLSIGEYVRDLDDARKGVDALAPLTIDPANRCEDVRVALRKPLVNGIRKACSKVLLQLEDNASLLAAKTRSYEAVKVEIGNLDEACRGVDSTAKVAPPTAADLSNRVAALSRSLEDFTNGLKKPDPPPEAEPAAAEGEAAPAPAVAGF